MSRTGVPRRILLVGSIGGVLFFLLISNILSGESGTTQTDSQQGLTPTAACMPAISTGDWNVYSNTQYSYSFRYPDYARLGEAGEDSGRPETSWQAVYLSLPGFYVRIIGHDNPEELTSVGYTERYFSSLERANVDILSVARHEAQQIDFLEERTDGTGTSVPTRVIILAHGGKILEFWVRVLSEGHLEVVRSGDSVNGSFEALLTDSIALSEDYQVFQAILSSLTFSD